MDKLFNKNFSLLLMSQIISMLGTQSHKIALIIWLKKQSHSASMISLIMILSALPEIIFSIIGGSFADRFNKKKILIITDIISFFAVLILALCIMNSENMGGSALYVVTLMSMLVSACQSLCRPVAKAMITSVSQVSNFQKSNSIIEFSGLITQSVGELIGSTLYQLLGAVKMFFIDSYSYLISGVIKFFIKYNHVPTDGFNNLSVSESFRLFSEDTIVGLKYILGQPNIRKLFLFSCCVNFFMTSLVILVPFYLENSIKVPSDYFGYFMGALSSGVFLGLLMANIKYIAEKKNFRILIFLSWPWIFILFFLTHSFAFSILEAFILGLSIGYINIISFTLLHKNTDPKFTGRVFGFLYSAAISISPIGMGITGFTLDAIEYKNSFIIFGAYGLCLICLVYYLFSSTGFKDFILEKKV